MGNMTGTLCTFRFGETKIVLFRQLPWNDSKFVVAQMIRGLVCVHDVYDDYHVALENFGFMVKDHIAYHVDNHKPPCKDGIKRYERKMKKMKEDRAIKSSEDSNKGV